LKSKVLIGFCALFLCAGLMLMIILPDKELSCSERRTLQQFPDFSLKDVLSAEWMKNLESYLLDQFPVREAFRSIKARTLFYVFRQSDNNGIYVGENGHIFDMIYPLNEESVQRFAQKLNSLYDKHLKNANVYYAVIPDKSRYSQVSEKHLQTDWGRQMEILTQNINPGITQISLMDTLTLDDYYRTDLHWRQERLFGVVERLGEHMGFRISADGLKENSYAPFYGAYYGQSALSPEPDTLIFLTGGDIDCAVVDDIQHSDTKTVYRRDRLGEMDSYDVFLSGATPLTTIQNPNNTSGKSLIIFRDSFASSLAPLLIEAYETITLIDLRYMSSEMLSQYVNFADQDVLFLYSEQIINNSVMLR